MIDIHAHIIPALDDGPPDMETSLAVGRMAARDGISAIISTSHSEEGANAGRAEMQRRLDEVRAAWLDEGIEIQLELGLEIYLVPGTAAELKAGRVWPLASSKYVLVELPYQPWPTYTERSLFDLQLAGYIPILAHPERYTAIQADPNLMYRLAEKGVLAQVTAGALLGDHGSNTRKTAETLVSCNMVQFISSDTHGVTPRKRPPNLTGAVQAAEKLIDPGIARAMVEDNPAAVLANRPVVPEPVPYEPPKWSIGRLFGRP